MMSFKERAFAPLVAVSLEELGPQDHFYLYWLLDTSVRNMNRLPLPMRSLWSRFL